MLGSRLHSGFSVCYSYARIQELHPILKRFIVRSTSFNQDDLLTDKSSLAVGVPESNIYVAQRPSIPLITKREIEFPNKHREPKQAWLESLDTLQDDKLGLVDLHPDIFGTYPRIDILHANIHWQRWYRKIDYAFVRNRAEMPGGGRKPRPQKKTGLKRQGSIRSPLWRGGGAAFGPRGPQSFYYMLPMSVRTLGLRVALSVKYAQNDLHIVNSLDIPSDDPKYIEDLIDTRFWGFSALFVDDVDIMPRNISLALKELPQFNLMPVYGLNVYSMLKHETLVLTLAAVEKLEKKLLLQMHKPESDVAYRKKH